MNDKKLNRFLWIFTIIGLIILVIYVTSDSTPSISSSSSTAHTCDYCGKYEDCKRYKVTYIAGYNKDGTVKLKYDNVYIGDRCISEARKSYKYAEIQ